MRRETKRWILWVGKLVTLVVYLVFLAYAIIVGIAFVLQLLGANPTADFADWIYRAADNITQPFRGIFPTTQVTDRSSFNASWLFALIVYLIVAVILHGIIDWLTRRIAGIDRAEEREQQMAAIEAQRESTRSALGLDQSAVAVQPAPVPTTATTVDPWVVPAGQTPPPPPQSPPSETAYPPQSGDAGYPPAP
jgi:uncharacterized protein YggT (Ycf19 family)